MTVKPRGRTVIDRRGERYGRLIVEERAGRDSCGNAIWRCRCDCGTVTEVIAPSLACGDTRSCGCLRRECYRGVRRAAREETPAYSAAAFAALSAAMGMSNGGELRWTPFAHATPPRVPTTDRARAKRPRAGRHRAQVFHGA